MFQHFVNSFSYTDNLQILLNNNTDNYSDYRRVPYNRQISNSAPTSTVDIEGLVKDECYREQDVMRDRRKKDVHNMSKYYFYYKENIITNLHWLFSIVFIIYIETEKYLS